MVFREQPIIETLPEIADLVFNGQGEGVNMQIELLSGSENALDLGESIAIGIRVWPSDPEQLFRGSTCNGLLYPPSASTCLARLSAMRVDELILIAASRRIRQRGSRF